MILLSNYSVLLKAISKFGKNTYCRNYGSIFCTRILKLRLTKSKKWNFFPFLYHLPEHPFQCSIYGIEIHPIYTTSFCPVKGKPKPSKKTLKPINFNIKPIKRSEVVEVWNNMTVEELARTMGKDVDHVFEAMMFVDNSIDYDTADASIDRTQVIKDVVKRSGFRCTFVPNPAALKSKKVFKDAQRRPPADATLLAKRAPVVTIMGHVDHGKTTLLDSLRHTSVVEQEFGGITQHIGAFMVKLPSGLTVTFLDTPGHAAFSAMRARGAKVTDIIVLVVAADDGVMPQTVESIQHSINANVPIIVAINKMDKYNANIDKSKRDLGENGIMLEEFGGDVQSVPISALKGTNLNLLVDAIITQAEVMDLKADPVGLVEGYVIESRTESMKGKLATVIVQRGTLKKGAVLVAGTAWGKVREMYDDKGQKVLQASPSVPVEVSGWKVLPSAGDEVLQVETEGRAREIFDYRTSIKNLEKQMEDYEAIKIKVEEHDTKYKTELQHRRQEGRIKKRKTGERPKESVEVVTGPRLPIILKGDVDGSVEAILNVLATYHSSKLPLDILQFGVGAVNESDVKMAHLFNAVIYAFNVQTLEDAKKYASSNNTPIKYFNIIYRLIEDLKLEMNARLPFVETEEILGQADVLQEFVINEGKSKVPVAGCVCKQGLLKKSELFRLKRGDYILHEGKLSSMRHQKNEVDSIKKDVECGLKFVETDLKFEPGDCIICLKKMMVPQTTDWNPGF